MPNLLSYLTALLSGLLFGAGLLLSGMANPAKVLGFLDLAGRWDPSLILVMAGAISVGILAFYIARRRTRTLLGLPMQWPANSSVTLRLILGSAAFGMGWGIAGFCPGPALVAMAAGHGKAWAFVAAMLTGMKLFDAIEQRRARAG